MPCVAQPGRDAAPPAATPGQALARDFGAIGLTGELNSDEHFGALQARLGAYTALQGSTARPDLSLQNIVAPAHVTVPLTNDGRWFVKLGSAFIQSWADDHGAALENTTTVTALAQLQFRPRPGTLIGLGPTYETNTVRLANGGRIKVPGAGLRFDLLQRFGQHLGFAAKVTWMNGTTDTTVPIGGGLVLHDYTSSPRLFAQAGLIGMIDHRTLSFLPQGWSLRPAVRLLAQRTTLAASTTNLGVVEPRQHQDYAETLLTVKLQRDEFRSGHLAPFVEAGTELRLDQALPTPADDPSLAYAKAGAAVRVGDWGFFDAYYAYRAAFNGAYRAGVAEVLASITF